MTKPTGWDTGLCQDYDRGLALWFASRLNARHTIRRWFGEQRKTMTVMTNEDPADPSVHDPKPAAYVVWAENGNCIMWTTNKAQAKECAERHQRPMRELYDQDVVTGLLAAEEGAAEAFGVVVQDKRDLENEVGRLRTLLEGAHATIRSMSARGGYQPVGTTGPVQPPPRKP